MSATTQRYQTAQQNEPKPGLIWAAVGAGFLALTIYVFGAWIMSPDFKRVYPAQSLDSTTQSLVFWNQAAFSLICVIILIYWVILPKIKTGHFSFMGLLVLASASTYWTDPLGNFFNYGITYNFGFWNMGSWANFIPGYSSRGMGQFPEAPLWVGTTYIWFNVGFPAIFAWLWKQINHRYPRLGFGNVFVGLLVLMALWDTLNETLYLRLHLYSYVGAPHAWSIFGGHYYQFPIFISIVTAFFFMGITWIIHFRDDKGLCFVERGIDKMNLSPGKTTFMRFLALTGFLNVLVIGIYWVPVQCLYTHGGTVPPDTPGYLIGGVCGANTGIACPVNSLPRP